MEARLLSIAEIISENVRKFREQLGMTQADLAEKSGITRRTIVKIENEGIDVSASTIFALSKALDTTPAQLVTSGEVRLSGDDAISEFKKTLDEALQTLKTKVILEKNTGKFPKVPK